MEESKTCSKCNQSLLVTNFSKFSRSRDGLAAWCRPCNRSYQKAHRLANLETYLAASLEWRITNKDYMQEYSKDYYQKNKPRLSQQNKLWTQANSEKKKQDDKKWVKANPEKVKINAKNWRLRNPGKESLNRQLRRARLKNATIFLVTPKDIESILSKPCLYCGEAGEHIDHILPLSKGGLHSIGNLTSSCRSCNLSKNNKTVMEWRLWKRRLDSDA